MPLSSCRTITFEEETPKFSVTIDIKGHTSEDVVVKLEVVTVPTESNKSDSLLKLLGFLRFIPGQIAESARLGYSRLGGWMATNNGGGPFSNSRGGGDGGNGGGNSSGGSYRSSSSSSSSSSSGGGGDHGGGDGSSSSSSISGSNRGSGSGGVGGGDGGDRKKTNPSPSTSAISMRERGTRFVELTSSWKTAMEQLVDGPTV